MTLIRPKTTPFAMTMPMSFPMPKRMAQSARKPAMVVVELPEREAKAVVIAAAMASLIFSCRCFSSSYLLYRKTE